jgi:carotenoid cleavage dioxygenase-like enzyme
MLLLPLLLHLVASARAADDLFVKWFDPQTAEIVDQATQLVVNGTIPSWIKGKLIRVGPTVWEKGGVQYSNYLDSFGRVSSYDLSGETNQVTFMSAIIRSLVWNHST